MNYSHLNFMTYNALVTLKFIYIFILLLTNSFMDTLSTPSYRIISNHVIAEVRRKKSNDQNALFALRAYKPGEVIATFSAGTISAEPTYLTVQIGIRKHITLQPEFLQYINHSCEPNVFFDTSSMELVALKELELYDEMTFFYPSTEWKMTQSFRCYCGNPECLGDIKGAAYLSKDAIEKYRLTDFIQQQLSKRRRATRKVA
jgi:hypothetical protein